MSKPNKFFNNERHRYLCRDEVKPWIAQCVLREELLCRPQRPQTICCSQNHLCGKRKLSGARNSPCSILKRCHIPLRTTPSCVGTLATCLSATRHRVKATLACPSVLLCHCVEPVWVLQELPPAGPGCGLLGHLDDPSSCWVTYFDDINSGTQKSPVAQFSAFQSVAELKAPQLPFLLHSAPKTMRDLCPDGFLSLHREGTLSLCMPDFGFSSVELSIYGCRKCSDL